MQQIRVILIVMILTISFTTIAAIVNEGANLLPHFLTPIIALTWQGQFNVDFACYLILTGIWVAWRGGFSRASGLTGLFAAVAGILFVAPLLIYYIHRAQSDPRRFLLGVHAG